MNILIPLAGQTAYDDDQIVPLVEIFNKTLIEYVISNLPFGREGNFVFVVKDRDCDRHYIDSILELVKPGAKVVRVPGETQGQLCSCLTAIEHIDNDEPLLIVNGNQFLFEDIVEIVHYFRDANADGGVITFPNVHPRWSYVRLASDDLTVVESSEKKPISRNACVGVFYYRRGDEFVAAAKDVIRKDCRVNGNFYVSSTLNSLILSGKRIIAQEVPGDAFCSLHTTHAVQNFIATLQERVA